MSLKPVFSLLWLVAASTTACAQGQALPNVLGIATGETDELPLAAVPEPVPDVEASDDVALSPLAAPASNHPFEAEDLGGYFATGQLRAAKDAFDAGRYRQARILLADQEATPWVRYLTALAALRSGDPAYAADELAELAGAYAPMRDSCLYEGGLAEERRGQMAAAVDRFLAVDAHSRLFPLAVMAASRDLLFRGDAVRAGQVLRPLLDEPQSDPVRAEALWQLANVEEHLKHRPLARAALLKLWAMGPRTALSSGAYGRLGGNIPPDVHAEHAESLLNANFGGAAMAELAPLAKRLKPPDPVGCRVHFLEGKALRKGRHHVAAIAELLPVVRECKDPALTARALYVLGYSQSVVDPPAALATYQALAQGFPEDPLADDGLFLSAELKARLGDGQGALADYEAVSRKYPDGEFAREAAFRAFWLNWKDHHFEQGVAELEALEQSHRTGDVQRARYWHARSLEALDRRDEAVAVMSALAADGTAGYYGEMARLRLAELDPARVRRVAGRSPFNASADVLWPLDAGKLSTDPHFLSGVELVRLGLPGAAAELLAIDRTQLAPSGKRLLFQVLYQGGYTQASAIFASATLSEDDGSLATDARLLWELTFPKSYRPAIERQSRRASVDPDLLQALIREESHFQSRARSSTGALGLAQLMPATARNVAGALKLHGYTTASLLDPERNIQLGSFYLAQLLRQFSGNRVLAVAAYNAGPNAVKRWRADRSALELDEFVEEIPVQETRDYVKKVLGGCRTYGQLYDETWPQLLVASE